MKVEDFQIDYYFRDPPRGSSEVGLILINEFLQVLEKDLRSSESSSRLSIILFLLRKLNLELQLQLYTSGEIEGRSHIFLDNERRLSNLGNSDIQLKEDQTNVGNNDSRVTVLNIV